MAIAGFCDVCGRNVYLTDQWGCAEGHGWDRITGWYDTDTGAAVTPYWLQASDSAAAPAAEAAPAAAETPTLAASAGVGGTAAPANANRTDLLAAILQTLAQYPGYHAEYGTDTDIVVDNKLADASWLGGRKKVEYSAILKALEAERTVYFWEVLKESGAGLSFGGFESESYSTFGTTRSGKTKQVVLGPDGKEVDVEWDYGATRKIIESVAAAHGWRVKTVLRKGSAKW